MKKCEQCGKEFEPNRNSARFCSKLCYRRWYERAHVIKRRESRKRQYWANPERNRRAGRKYYADNPEKCRKALRKSQSAIVGLCRFCGCGLPRSSINSGRIKCAECSYFGKWLTGAKNCNGNEENLALQAINRNEFSKLKEEYLWLKEAKARLKHARKLPLLHPELRDSLNRVFEHMQR